MVLWMFIIQVMRVTSAPFGAALLLFALTAVLAFVRPTLALGVVIPLALVGDDIAMGWWPVMINFSNHDSVLFLTDSATVKPFDARVSQRATSEPRFKKPELSSN